MKARASFGGALLALALLTSCADDAPEATATPDSVPTESASEPNTPAPTALPSPGNDSSPAAPPSAKPTEKSPTKTTPTPEPVTVPSSLRFTGTTVDGKAFDAASLAGRPVVLWFWAPWCTVCRSQIPTVESLASKYDGEATVLGIGSLDDASTIREFADDLDGGTHLTDPNGALWRKFGITEQSSFVVLDATGKEIMRSGYADDDGLADAVARAVAG